MEFGTIMTSVQNVLKITNQIKKKKSLFGELSQLPRGKEQFHIKKE